MTRSGRSCWVVIAVMLAGSLTGCAGGRAQDPGKLEGVLWVATGIRTEAGALQPVVTGSEITAEFGDGRVGGTGGVNRYGAVYETSGDDAITIYTGPSTLMGGPPELMEQEQLYFTRLGEAARFAATDTSLELLDEDGGVLVRYEAREPVALEGTTWYCTAYNNGTGGFTSLVADSRITAVFASDGTLSGSAGVNDYTGSYETVGSDMTIDPAIAATRKAGPEDLMEQEAAYLAALPRVAKFEIEGDGLTLFGADGARLAGYSAVEPR